MVALTMSAFAGGASMRSGVDTKAPDRYPFKATTPVELATRLAASSYTPRRLDAGSPLRQISYDQFRDIRVNPELAIWRKEQVPFRLELLPAGFVFDTPVTVSVVENGIARDVFAPPEKFEQSQPVLYTEGDGPPMLLMHGEDDEIVEVKNTRSMASAVKKAGGAIETVIYPKMSHRMIIASVAKPLRGQTDVLGHISEFVTRWSNTPRASGNQPANDGSGVQGIPLPIY